MSPDVFYLAMAAIGGATLCGLRSLPFLAAHLRNAQFNRDAEAARAHDRELKRIEAGRAAAESQKVQAEAQRLDAIRTLAGKYPSYYRDAPPCPRDVKRGYPEV